MPNIEEVVLRNGAKEVKPLVVALMMAARSLIEDNPIAFYELICLCRNTNHELWGNAAEVLRTRNLIDDRGKVHDSCRNILPSAVIGDGLDMRIRSPLAETPSVSATAPRE